MWLWTDRQTDTHRRTWPQYISCHLWLVQNVTRMKMKYPDVSSVQWFFYALLEIRSSPTPILHNADSQPHTAKIYALLEIRSSPTPILHNADSQPHTAKLPPGAGMLEKSQSINMTQLHYQHDDDVPCEVKCGSITLDEICMKWRRILRLSQVQVANSILSTPQ